MDKSSDNATRRQRSLSGQTEKTALALMLDTFRSLLLDYLHHFLSLCWRPTARHLGLVSLPVEIRAEAFAYLDFPGVLAVKLVRYILPYPCHFPIFDVMQTCKTFYSVTKMRQFWHNRINTLIQAHYICPPEDELDSYAVNELEQWTLRRACVLDVCTSSRKPRFRKRTVGLRCE
jgi:hypothetical protein